MHSLPATPSPLLTYGFCALALVMIVFWTWAAGTTASDPASRRKRQLWTGGGLIAWAGLTAWLGSLAWLHDFSPFPPPAPAIFAATFVATVVLGLSPIGRGLVSGLGLPVLVGFQAFRIPVELLLHRAFEEGLIPVQMTYLGRNFDVLSGLFALVLGIFLLQREAPRWAVGAWNVLSLGLLINIVAIAILSMPTPLRAFAAEPANVFVAHTPFVWLPTLLVTSALLGHVLVFRKMALG